MNDLSRQKEEIILYILKEKKPPLTAGYFKYRRLFII